MTESLSDWIERYRCTEAFNDAIYRRFGELTDGIDYLKQHRDFVEENRWGMGFRPFHYLWYLIFKDCGDRLGTVSALEIGVYMGQVIALWGLLGRRLGVRVEISALSPFASTQPRVRLVKSLRKRFSRRYREQIETGTFSEDENLYGRTREIYERFAGPFDEVHVYRGLSSDRRIRKALADRDFTIVYIDGDHSYEGVRSDLAFYAPRVLPEGYLVMDDAAYFLPGTAFHKGFESVARAADAIEAMGFRNVLNVGHNRVYRRHRA